MPGAIENPPGSSAVYFNSGKHSSAQQDIDMFAVCRHRLRTGPGTLLQSHILQESVRGAICTRYQSCRSNVRRDALLRRPRSHSAALGFGSTASLSHPSCPHSSPIWVMTPMAAFPTFSGRESWNTKKFRTHGYREQATLVTVRGSAPPCQD